MRATQLAIAKAVGVDVSTVNKILNKFPGAVFHKDTIKRVHQEARRQGFSYDRKSKGSYLRALIDLVNAVAEIPHDQASRELAYAFARARRVITGQAVAR